MPPRKELCRNFTRGRYAVFCGFSILLLFFHVAMVFNQNPEILILAKIGVFSCFPAMKFKRF